MIAAFHSRLFPEKSNQDMIWQEGLYILYCLRSTKFEIDLTHLTHLYFLVVSREPILMRGLNVN